MSKEIFVSLGVHFDAVAGWLGSYGGEDSLCDISRGVFAGEVGVPRILNLMKKYDIIGSWYMPGHSIESFPKEAQMVADAGHEVGLHGYSHENPRLMSIEQERAMLIKSIGLIEKLTGKKPTGNNTPWWEFSPNTFNLLQELGVIYDNSLMAKDFEPYYATVGDTWTKIDYDKPAEEWMKPYVKGEESDLVVIPASWYFDDLPPMMFVKASVNSYGFANPWDIVRTWKDQFDWVYREMDYATISMCIHPDVSGRPHVLLQLEKLFEHMKRQPGVKFVTNDFIAKDFMKRNPRSK